MKTLKISSREIIKLCYGDCNCALMSLVVYYGRSSAMELVAGTEWAQCEGGKNCRSYRADHQGRFGLVLVRSHDDAAEAA